MGTVKPTIHDSHAVFTLRVEREKLARMHEIAASEHRTLNQKLRAFIDAEIERTHEERAA